jgi:hypothetical protein
VGGAEVGVALPESVDVLFDIAVAVTLASCAVELVALHTVRRHCAAEDNSPGVEDARLWLDETAGARKLTPNILIPTAIYLHIAVAAVDGCNWRVL